MFKRILSVFLLLYSAALQDKLATSKKKFEKAQKKGKSTAELALLEKEISENEKELWALQKEAYYDISFYFFQFLKSFVGIKTAFFVCSTEVTTVDGEADAEREAEASDVHSKFCLQNRESLWMNEMN